MERPTQSNAGMPGRQASPQGGLAGRLYSPEGITLAYLAVGALWIIVSDSLIHTLLNPERAVFVAQSAKGLAFVGVTGGLLYLLLARWRRREHERERAIAESEERFEQLAQRSEDDLWFCEAAPLRILYLSPAFERVWGLPRARLFDDPMAWRTLIHPEDREKCDRDIGQFINGQIDRLDTELRIIRPDGRTRWLSFRGVRIAPDRTGRPRIAGITRDITERKETELRQQMLMDELDHRVKNNLASVLSIAQQTVQRSARIEEFEPSFIGRIEAMARTHALLAATKWEGVDVRQMVEATLAPFEAEGRLRAEGPPGVLPRHAAQPLCLALHELATNAAKHGALAAPGGAVAVSWAFRMESDGEVALALRWQENNPGRTLAPPASKGFGLRFIEGVVRHELRGGAEIAFAPDGLRCDLRVPLSPDPHQPPAANKHDGRAKEAHA